MTLSHTNYTTEKIEKELHTRRYGTDSSVLTSFQHNISVGVLQKINTEMLDELGWPPLSQTRQETQLILLYIYKSIKGLAEVTFEGI